MKKILLVGAVLSIVAGCVTTKPPVTLSNEFSASEAAIINKAGKNTIKGNAFLRQNGGGVVTCAGSDVLLIPATKYAKERIGYIYGSENGGYNPVYSGQSTFTPEPPEYSSMVKTTTCNSDGKFEFKNVANGDYYVLAKVIWQVRSYQGGSLMRKVNVKNGQAIDLVMSQ